MKASTRKAALKAELLERLRASVTTARNAHRSAVEGATHGEAKQENDKDTRGLEQSYIARGQALRIETLDGEIARVQAMAIEPASRVSAAALVTVEEDERTLIYFIAPHGGGVMLEKGQVQVVTPGSPLGQALLGKRVGDDCEVLLQGKRRELAVTAVE